MKNCGALIAEELDVIAGFDFMLCDLDFLFVGPGLEDLHGELYVSGRRKDGKVEAEHGLFEEYLSADELPPQAFGHLVHLLNPCIVPALPLYTTSR